MQNGPFLKLIFYILFLREACPKVAVNVAYGRLQKLELFYSFFF